VHHDRFEKFMALVDEALLRAVVGTVPGNR